MIPDDLVPISRCVRFDDSSGWRYELPPGIKEVVNNQQTRPRSGRGGGVPTASGSSWPRRRWDRSGVRDEDILLDGDQPVDNITAVEQAGSRRGRGRGGS